MAQVNNVRKTGSKSKNNEPSVLVFRVHYEADDGISHMTACFPQPQLPEGVKDDLGTVVQLFWAGLDDDVALSESEYGPSMCLRSISVHEVFGDPTDHNSKERYIQQYDY